MATPRSVLVDSEQPLFYHLASRCVRGGWLLGEHEGKSYHHRKDWIETRLLELAPSYALDIYGFAVMSNHFHIVVHFDPRACERWSDEEVASRWSRVFGLTSESQSVRKQRLLEDKAELNRCREHLGCMSKFMKHLKQPISVRANAEDQVSGHFFEKRFYSGALLDEESVIAALQYVDLNPFRAEIAESLEAAAHTSVHRRIEAIANSQERLDEFLAPIVGGIESHSTSDVSETCYPSKLGITLRTYLELLRDKIHCEREEALTRGQRDRIGVWQHQVHLFQRRQRAYGKSRVLTNWLDARQLRPIDRPLM